MPKGVAEHSFLGCNHQSTCIPSYSLYVQLLWYSMYYPEWMKARISHVQWSKHHSILAPTQDSTAQWIPLTPADDPPAQEWFLSSWIVDSSLRISRFFRSSSSLPSTASDWFEVEFILCCGEPSRRIWRDSSWDCIDLRFAFKSLFCWESWVLLLGRWFADIDSIRICRDSICLCWAFVLSRIWFNINWMSWVLSFDSWFTAPIEFCSTKIRWESPSIPWLDWDPPCDNFTLISIFSLRSFGRWRLFPPDLSLSLLSGISSSTVCIFEDLVWFPPTCSDLLDTRMTCPRDSPPIRSRHSTAATIADIFFSVEYIASVSPTPLCCSTVLQKFVDNQVLLYSCVFILVLCSLVSGLFMLALDINKIYSKRIISDEKQMFPLVFTWLNFINYNPTSLSKNNDIAIILIPIRRSFQKLLTVTWQCRNNRYEFQVSWLWSWS